MRKFFNILSIVLVGISIFLLINESEYTAISFLITIIFNTYLLYKRKLVKQ